MKVKVHNPANLPTIDYRKLQPLQGNLKDFHEREYEKLKKSLKEFGWVYPFFVWDNAKDGIKYLIDGHGRHRLATREGVQPYELPYYPIHAADLQEAKKLLLVATSQYQRITQEGFDEFTFDVDDSWLAETVNFDGVFSDVPPAPGGNVGSFDDTGILPASTYAVTVTCESEAHQIDVFERLRGMGYNVKVVVV